MKRTEEIIKSGKVIIKFLLLSLGSFVAIINLLSLINFLTRYKYSFLNSVLMKVSINTDAKDISPFDWVNVISTLLVLCSIFILIKILKKTHNNTLVRALLITTIILFIISIIVTILTSLLIYSISNSDTNF
jgi:hypothetical protein